MSEYERDYRNDNEEDYKPFCNFHGEPGCPTSAREKIRARAGNASARQINYFPPQPGPGAPHYVLSFGRLEEYGWIPVQPWQVTPPKPLMGNLLQGKTNNFPDLNRNLL